MSVPEQFPAGGEQPPDLAAILADTLLLDSLGRGEPAPDGDEVAAMLAAWRAELEFDLDSDVDVDRDAERLAGLGTDLPAQPAVLRPGRPVGADEDIAPVTPIDAGRGRRWSRILVGIAAAVVLLVAGGLIGAANAGPGSPLWPLTRVVYPDQADTMTAEHTIAQARQAAAEGRYDDARRLLDQAGAQVAKLRDPRQAARLRAEIDDILRSIPASASNTGTEPSVGTTPTPGAPGATGGPGAGVAPGGGSTPGGNVTGTGGVQAPGLPTVPVPSLPVPTTSAPGLPLPTLPLPTLPLSTPPLPLPH